MKKEFKEIINTKGREFREIIRSGERYRDDNNLRIIIRISCAKCHHETSRGSATFRSLTIYNYMQHPSIMHPNKSKSNLHVYLSWFP